MSVYMLSGKGNALATEGLQDKVVYRPERIFGKGIGAKPILIAHHDQLEVQMLLYETQVGKHTRNEPQFGKGVNLLVLGFLYQRSISVNKQYFLWFHRLSLF